MQDSFFQTHDDGIKLYWSDVPLQLPKLLADKQPEPPYSLGLKSRGVVSSVIG